MRKIQYETTVVVDGVAASQHIDVGESDARHTGLSTPMHWQAASRSVTTRSTFDSMILDHFGDGPVLDASGKGKERALPGSSQNSRSSAPIELSIRSGGTGNSDQVMQNDGKRGRETPAEFAV